MSVDPVARASRVGAAATESRALAFAFASLVFGCTVGALYFAGQSVALSGARSVGVTAAAVAGVVAIVAFSTGYLRLVFVSLPRPLSSRVRWRVVLDTVALSVTAAIVVVLLIASSFAVLQLAFREFALDAAAAALIVGVVAAASGYVVTAAASQMTTRAMANLLAMFLISGGLASMLSAHDPRWWQRNFSALGGGDGFSSYTFNITIVFAGLVVVTLTHHLTVDIHLHSQHVRPEYLRSPKSESGKIRVLRIWLVAVGLLLAGIGLIAVDEAAVVHTIIAISMSLVFAGLVVAAPFLVPWLPRSFQVVSAVVVAGFVGVVVLMWPVGYFNLTAVELLGSVLLLTWLVLFVRAVAAAVDDDAPDLLPADSKPADFVQGDVDSVTARRR